MIGLFNCACGLLCIGLALFSTAAGAKDPPSVLYLIKWTECLKSTDFNPLVDRSPNRLEDAFRRCAAQESTLRSAIARDPSPPPAEYNVDNMKGILRAQQHERVK